MPTPESHPHNTEHPQTTPSPSGAPKPDDKPKVSLKDACQHILSACDALQERLGHAYGCPAASSGECTCGSKALHEALHELHDALGA
ncbi:MAG TPA: hypothetical protein VKB20_11915 [Steroidobacteraceae bacterium]|nr:hypothetical protein [Steroidobacteraceae bacterium]